MIVPSTKPGQTRTVSESMLLARGWDREMYPVAILGVRAFFTEMGKPGENDRGMYDDAIIVVSPTAYATFNANTDPSVFRAGIAKLRQGAWLYKIGKHKVMSPLGYKALVQAAPVTVDRDGGASEKGWFGINIHRGSMNGTSSLGCQTIYPPQWDAFIALVEGELKRHGQEIVPYVLASAI